jgi:hypothetical protein
MGGGNSYPVKCLKEMASMAEKLKVDREIPRT